MQAIRLLAGRAKEWRQGSVASVEGDRLSTGPLPIQRTLRAGSVNESRADARIM